MIRLPFVRRSRYEELQANCDWYREKWLIEANRASVLTDQRDQARAELARWKPDRASDGRFRGRR